MVVFSNNGSIACEIHYIHPLLLLCPILAAAASIVENDGGICTHCTGFQALFEVRRESKIVCLWHLIKISRCVYEQLGTHCS